MTCPDRLTLTAKRHLDWRRARHDIGPAALVTPELLRAARRACGLTQRQLAERFGIPYFTWRNWESGVATPGRGHQPALLRWIDARLHPKSRTVKGRGGA